MKKLIEKQKGVTLIALIITIIVLLLLAFTVTNIIGNNGIIDKTLGVAEETKINKYKEDIENEIAKIEINSVREVDMDDIIDKLKDKKIIEKGISETGQVKTDDDYIYEIKQKPNGDYEIKYIGKGDLEEVEYNITFIVDGNIYTTIEKVKKIVFPETDPVLTGCIFNGWYYNEEKTSKANIGDIITKNITLYADWIKNTLEKHVDVKGMYASVAYELLEEILIPFSNIRNWNEFDIIKEATNNRPIPDYSTVEWNEDGGPKDEPSTNLDISTIKPISNLQSNHCAMPSGLYLPLLVYSADATTEEIINAKKIYSIFRWLIRRNNDVLDHSVASIFEEALENDDNYPKGITRKMMVEYYGWNLYGISPEMTGEINVDGTLANFGNIAGIKYIEIDKNATNATLVNPQEGETIYNHLYIEDNKLKIKMEDKWKYAENSTSPFTTPYNFINGTIGIKVHFKDGSTETTTFEIGISFGNYVS